MHASLAPAPASHTRRRAPETQRAAIADIQITTIQLTMRILLHTCLAMTIAACSPVPHNDTPDGEFNNSASAALADPAPDDPPLCGDAVADPGEECDNGPSDTPRCNGSDAFGEEDVSCKFARCGDVYTNTSAGEECDQGSSDSVRCNGARAGSVACHRSFCGDGYANHESGEDCDVPSDTTLCNGAGAAETVGCRRARCGDEYLNRTAGEQCESDTDCTDGTQCNGCFCL